MHSILQRKPKASSLLQSLSSQSFFSAFPLTLLNTSQCSQATETLLASLLRLVFALSFASFKQHVSFNFTMSSARYFMPCGCNSHTFPPPSALMRVHLQQAPKPCCGSSALFCCHISFAFISLANTSTSLGSGPASTL